MLQAHDTTCSISMAALPPLSGRVLRWERVATTAMTTTMGDAMAAHATIRDTAGGATTGRRPYPRTPKWEKLRTKRQRPRTDREKSRTQSTKSGRSTEARRTHQRRRT